jgi:hypothetical protein
MRKTGEYIKDERIRFLTRIIQNFDFFEIGKKYVIDYNKYFRDYEYELHKLNEKTIYMYIFNNKIEIEKVTENKYTVTINLNDYNSIAERKRIMWFTKYENKKYRSYLLWYYRKIWHLDLGNLEIPIRRDNNLLKLLIVRKPRRYYLTLPELERRELPDREYGFQIDEDSLYLYEINGKKVKYILEHSRIKNKDIPYINRVKIRNRKYEYSIFKMMLNKGILQPRVSAIPPTIKRIRDYELRDYAWMFTNIVMLTLQRIRGGQFPDFIHTTLQDFDYDNVNQILLKFIDEFRNSYLCGIDYSNILWCMRLPGIMYKYHIKSVYRVLYNLDEKTKMFEF